MYGKPGDDASLLRRYQATQDLAARDELVRKYLPLVRSLAKRYSYTSEPLEDLCQVGAIALCKAIDRYREGSGASFKAYAVPTIIGELRRHFRDNGWALHIPRSLQERARTVGVALNDLSARLGRSPTIAEIADRSGVSDEEVLEVIHSERARTASSLSAPVGGEEPALEVADDESGYDRAEAHVLLEAAVHTLDERDRRILALRFGHGLSQSQIAAEIGISQMHVSRLLRRAFERLRAELGELELIE